MVESFENLFFEALDIDFYQIGTFPNLPASFIAGSQLDRNQVLSWVAGLKFIANMTT